MGAARELRAGNGQLGNSVSRASPEALAVCGCGLYLAPGGKAYPSQAASRCCLMSGLRAQVSLLQPVDGAAGELRAGDDELD